MLWMTTISRKQLAAASEMLRKGATLLGEACPICGGVQLKYKGEVICIVCSAQKDKDASKPSVPALGVAHDVLEGKVRELVSLLKDESSIDKQRELLDLLTRYIDLLYKLGQRQAAQK